MKPKRMRYITRIDDRSCLWWVRFMDGRSNKKLAAKTFPDRRHGGKQKALAAAQAWRDEMAVKLGKADTPFKDRGKFRTRPRSNTGTVGVTRFEYTDKHGRARCGFAVIWRETHKNGKRISRKKTFSVPPNDPDAWARQERRAIAWRKQMEKLHYTGPKPKPKKRATVSTTTKQRQNSK